MVGKVFWLGALEATRRRRTPARRSCCSRWSAGVRAAGRRSSVAGEAEYPSATCCCATSPTSRSRARPAATSTAARRLDRVARPPRRSRRNARSPLPERSRVRQCRRASRARAGRSCAPRAAGRRRPRARPRLLCRRRPLLQRCACGVARESDPDRVWLLVHAGSASHAANGSGIEMLERGFEELRSLARR